LLYVPDVELRQRLQNLKVKDSLTGSRVDELRYLFLASQVELIESADALKDASYTSQSDVLSIGVVKADGEKCDRCWNYSVHVGESAEHPILCERCIPALKGEF